MSLGDRHPLADGPMTDRIRQSADNRLGAVYSALYSFWHARHAATAVGRQTIGARRDAYSIILFSRVAIDVLSNDFTSSPDQLLNFVLAWQTDRGTKFTAALGAGQAVMEQYWSTERLVTQPSSCLAHIFNIYYNTERQSWSSFLMGKAQCPTRQSKIFVGPRSGLGESFFLHPIESLTLPKEIHYRSILSPSGQILRPPRFVGWPGWLSKSRIMHLVVLGPPK
jgi:hypothetical protein